MGKLDGQVVLVTGGASGMGAASAVALAAEGAHVAVCDIAEDAGEAVASQVKGSFHRLDVAEEAAWKTTVEQIESAHGPISALVNSAGVPGQNRVQDTTTEDWERVLSVNLTGTFLGIRTVAPSMERAGGGVIVNISSAGALAGFEGMASYSASKWGVRGLTRCAALDLADSGIRVVSVHPGIIRTPMAAHLPPEATARLPVPRPGEADEVARLVLYLIADATYSTGSEFVIDGGRTAGYRG